MARTILVLNVAVVLRSLIDVLDEDADRHPRRDLTARIVVHHHAGVDARLIRFAPLGGEARGSRPAPVEVGSDVGRLQRDSRRAAVDDATNSGAVARRKW